MKERQRKKNKLRVRMRADLVVESPTDLSNIINSCKIVSCKGMSIVSSDSQIQKVTLVIILVIGSGNQEARERFLQKYPSK